MIAELQKRTREYFEDDEHNALDYVAEWQAEGKTLLSLARAISKSAKITPELSPAQIGLWLRTEYGKPVVDARLKEARREYGADALVEQTIDAADAVTSKEEASVAKVRNDARQWIAARWNRDQYDTSSKTAVQVNVSVGQLHLDAMRKRELPVAEVRLIEAPAEEAEVEQESD